MVRFFRSWQGIALAVAILAAAGVGVAWKLTRPPTAVDALDAWKRKGEINVGVRSAAAPFSSLGTQKTYVGYEPDIAKAIAGALGAKAQFVVVDDGTALDFLKRGVVDFVIVPRPGLSLRDPTIRAIEPGYYASGFNAVTLQGTSLKKWDDLKGQAVCGLQSNAPAKQIVEELGGNFISFTDRSTALEALTAERCAAFINDEVGLRESLRSDTAQRFRIAFDTIDVTPWTIAVRTSDGALGDFISAELAQFHRSGFLIEQAGVWHLPPNPYLVAMRQYYSR